MRGPERPPGTRRAFTASPYVGQPGTFYRWGREVRSEAGPPSAPRRGRVVGARAATRKGRDREAPRHLPCQAGPAAVAQNRLPWCDTSLTRDRVRGRAGPRFWRWHHGAGPPPRPRGPPGATAATRSGFPSNSPCAAASELELDRLIRRADPSGGNRPGGGEARDSGSSPAAARRPQRGGRAPGPSGRTGDPARLRPGPSPSPGHSSLILMSFHWNVAFEKYCV